MNYRVRRQGQDLGIFSADELRRRRESGEFAGNEYVQREDTSDWQPLDLVLQQGYRTPPPLPGSVSTGGPNLYLIGGIIAVVVIFFVIFAFIFVQGVQRGFTMARRRAQTSYLNVPRPEAVAAASKPIVWTTNSLTANDAQERAREFRVREWLDGYEERGQRNPPCDAEVIQYLQVWIARNYGGSAATNPMSLTMETERLAANTNCTDPLVLTVIGVETPNIKSAKGIEILQRAVNAFPQSHHRTYPQFYATVCLMDHLNEGSGDDTLEAAALQQFQKSFTDGSFATTDQQEVAEIFVNGWGKSFFYQQGDAVCKIVHGAGTNFNWLALVLDGENEINQAWAARGGGYANTVTDAGWKKFRNHLASARNALTEAWNLQPTWPLASCRMMTVALGDSDLDEMRTWFDRTTTAQIDYPGAWSEMRWGLRPRWYGNEAAMLALGRAALNTRRFDAKVPEQFIDCVYDVESEMGLPSGKLFSRSDIWPDLQFVYEGYIRQTIPYPQHHREWITAYAIAAYRAEKYDVAREQLEKMNWRPEPTISAEWNLDVTLWPLEIAARTGPLGKEINAAELLYENGSRSAAVKTYSQLELNSKVDTRTKEFIQRRLAMLGQHLLITPQSYSLPPTLFTN